jgi:two-component system, cell cycle response regulator
VPPHHDWDEETNVTDQAEVDPIAPDKGEVAYLIVLAGATVGEMFKVPTGEAVIGRGKRSEIELFDEGVSRAHARILSQGDHVWVEDLGSRNGTFVNGEKVDSKVKLADGDKIQVGRTTILKFTYHDSLEESFQKQMYESALRDGLTNVFNKRYFTERLNSELRFATRHRAALALLMIDLDHFKQVNDTYGHVAGDRVLVAVAGALAKSVRNEDVVARYGGEEFAVLLRATPVEHVKTTAERLRRQVEALTVDAPEGEPAIDPIHVTVSIGIATYPEQIVATPPELIELADQALYRAKHAGRNRVAE